MEVKNLKMKVGKVYESMKGEPWKLIGKSKRGLVVQREYKGKVVATVEGAKPSWFRKKL